MLKGGRSERPQTEPGKNRLASCAGLYPSIVRDSCCPILGIAKKCV